MPYFFLSNIAHWLMVTLIKISVAKSANFMLNQATPSTCINEKKLCQLCN